MTSASAITVPATPDPALAEHARAIHELAKRTCQDIIEIGRHLTEARAHVGHGAWLDWIDTEFGWSSQTAYRFIHVYELSENTKFHTLVEFQLPVAALYQLAAPKTPEEARTEIAKRIEAGEKPTCAQVAAVITQAKGKNNANDKVILRDHKTGKEYLEADQDAGGVHEQHDDGGGLDEHHHDDREQGDHVAYTTTTNSGGQVPSETTSSKVGGRKPKLSLVEVWDAASPEERQQLRDQVQSFSLLELFEVSTTEEKRPLVERVLADFFADTGAVRTFLDRLGVDGMREAMSEEFGAELRARFRAALPDPKRFKTEHAVRTGIDETGKPIFALQGRGSRFAWVEGD